MPCRHCFSTRSTTQRMALTTHSSRTCRRYCPTLESLNVGCVVKALLRHAGYSWDSNRVWLSTTPDEKAERRATTAPNSSRPATPRDEMQQLPTNLEHDAGTPTEATRAADAARPPEPAGMASTAPETLDQLGPLGSGSVARPLEESFFDELVSTSYSIEPHLPCPHTWTQCSPHHSRPWTRSAVVLGRIPPIWCRSGVIHLARDHGEPCAPRRARG